MDSAKSESTRCRRSSIDPDCSRYLRMLAYMRALPSVDARTLLLSPGPCRRRRARDPEHAALLLRGRARLRAARGLRALVGVQQPLPQPHGLRRDLDALVLAQPLQRLVERQPPGRHEALELVGRRGPDVRQVLLAHDVHVEVFGADVLADDHARVDLVARRDEELAALLQ